MLDENLPTFVIKQSSDNPLSRVVYFTHNGSDPTPEYSFRTADPSLPESRNRYDVALSDARSQGVIFAEVLIEPEWQQPTLSASEIRTQSGAPPPLVPLIPDFFTIRLYNPDQRIPVRGEKSSWTGKESWEFEMPQQSFRLPSSSTIDRQQHDPVASELTPKIMFRWKRDSKFSKDMTCYMCGKSVGGRKNKEPDITLAQWRQGKEPRLTVYEPNLQRVEIEDRKGFEVVLLLGAEVIREIYLYPTRDSFNLGAAPRRKRNSPRPVKHRTNHDPLVMSGGLGTMRAAARTLSHGSGAEIDAETRRLQAMLQQEELERERRDLEEQRRIKMMLEEEEEERKRRDAEVARETERLRMEYGVPGHDADANQPVLPPRPIAGPFVAGPPVNAGPSQWWHGRGGGRPPPPSRTSGGGHDKTYKKRSVFF